MCEFATAIGRKTISLFDNLSEIIVETAGQRCSGNYTATQRAATIAHDSGSHRNLIEDGTGLVTESARALLGGGQLCACGSAARIDDFNLEPGTKSEREHPKMPVPNVAMRKDLPSAAGGPSTANNSSGGGRD